MCLKIDVMEKECKKLEFEGTLVFFTGIEECCVGHELT
jgi:hypothetical protein